MILRDPVHGLVDFEGDAERVVGALLGTREVQRLRRIRQLGLTSLVFPGAEHSRFAHAVGAAHVMTRLFARIRAIHDALPPEHRLDADGMRDALAAALLHDLGHGPFSHLFEEVQPGHKHHEDWTVEALRDPGTEVHRALEGLSSGMAERVAGMLHGEHRLRYLARAVSGTLDVDRADYLLRDSHMTGVRYGLYDLDWLLRALGFGEVAGEWVLAVEGRKGLPPIESFFLGRHFMYQQVYHHKATRAAEALIRGLFARAGELVRDGRPPDRLPPALASAARGETVSLGEYLDLDDAALLSCFAQWESSDDTLLAGLATRLRKRRLPKTLPLDTDVEESLWLEIERRAREVAAASGVRADLEVRLDVAEDTPYDEPEGLTAAGLWVLIRHRAPQRLGDASFLLGELRGKTVRVPRLLFPGELREPILAALGDLLPA
ncbi:MAG: HD domain-containing protein [Sandaracinus sp.]|nr:HD domain-containing protein [Sandaracinus sp.]